MTAARFAAPPVLLFCLALGGPAAADTVDVLPGDGEVNVPVADGDHHDDHAAGAHEEHPEGLPVQANPDLALWSGIVFLLFLAALWFLAWKPVGEGLNKREDRIRNDLAAAERHRVESERHMARHAAEMANAQEQVKEILAEARRDAEVAKSNILAEAQTAAKTERDRALHDIERAKEQALADLFDTYNDRVAAATESVLRRGLTAEDQSRLIDEAVSEFRGAKA